MHNGDPRDDILLSDEELVARCDVHTYKSSGPGGQHRNKVSSAVRLKHRASGVSAHGDDSRSQHQNKAMAIRRLRMNMACSLRREIDLQSPPPPMVKDRLFVARGGDAKGATRFAIGSKDAAFWPVAAWVLDLLEAVEGRVSDAAAVVGVSTANLTKVLQQERHLLSAVQEIRKRHGLKPLN